MCDESNGVGWEVGIISERCGVFMGESEWITARDAAKLLHRRRECVHLYIRKGLLRATQMVPRGHVLVSRKSVEDLLNRRINRPANSQSLCYGAPVDKNGVRSQH